jgi:hypothetical protein
MSALFGDFSALKIHVEKPFPQMTRAFIVRTPAQGFHQTQASC